jgi:hypothetical protein
VDNPAGLEDVRGSIERPLTSDEERVIPTWLGKAWRELNRVVPGITTRNELPTDDPQHLATDDVKDVVVAMVERKVRNADGLRTWAGDDYSQTIDAALSSGQLYVTEAERVSLMPRDIVGHGGMYSIPLTVY